MIYRLLIFLLVVCSFPLMAGAQDASLEQIQKKIDGQDYNGALALIDEVLLKDPANIEVQEMKINLLVKQEREKDAMKDIERFLFQYPADPEYHYLRAVLNLQKQRYAKAIEDFDNAIGLGMPDKYKYKVYLNRGMAHFFNQDYELALGDFDEVIGLQPKNATAYHGKGMVYYEMNEYENAIQQFKVALGMEPDNAITHFNLAMAYFRMDDTSNACFHFNKSCDLGHRNACRLLLMNCDIKIPQ